MHLSVHTRTHNSQPKRKGKRYSTTGYWGIAEEEEYCLNASKCPPMDTRLTTKGGKRRQLFPVWPSSALTIKRRKRFACIWLSTHGHRTLTSSTLGCPLLKYKFTTVSPRRQWLLYIFHILDSNGLTGPHDTMALGDQMRINLAVRRETSCLPFVDYNGAPWLTYGNGGVWHVCINCPTD